MKTLSFGIPKVNFLLTFLVYLTMITGNIQASGTVFGKAKKTHHISGIKTKLQTTLDITSLAPANNSTGLPFDLSRLEINFSEPVLKGPAGTGILIKKYDDDRNIITIPVSNDNVVIDGAKVTIELENRLPPDTPLYVEILPNTFISTLGNLFAGISDKSQWRFSLAPIPPLTLAALKPANNSTNLPSELNQLEITFSEPVLKGPAGTGILINNYDNDDNVAGFPVGSDNISIDGAKVTLQLDNLLPTETPLYVEIRPNTFVSTNGSFFAGTQKDTWQFALAAPPELTIATLTPSNNSTALDFGLNQLEIVFSEPVQKSRLRKSIQIKNYDTDRRVAAFSISDRDIVVENEKVTIQLDSPLPDGAPYYVQIQPDAFISRRGGSFAGTMDKDDWKFELASIPVPSVETLNPANNSTNVSLNLDKLEITFSEPVKKDWSRARIRIKNYDNDNIVAAFSVGSSDVVIDGAKVTMQLSTPLPPGTPLYVQIPDDAFVNEVGGVFPGILDKDDWRFALIAVPDLTIQTLVPANNSTNLPFDLDKLEITFSEPVQIGRSRARILIKNYNTDRVVASFAASNDNIRIEDAKVTIPLENLLPPDTPYYVEIEPNAFISLFRGQFAGIEDKNDWRFALAPAPKLTITTLVPANNSTDLPFDVDKLEITFSEPIEKGRSSANIRVKNYKNDRNVITFRVNDNDITINGAKATIQLDQLLPPGTSYYVEIEPNAFISQNGGIFDGITDKNDWRFALAPIEDLTLETFTPANNSTDVPTNLATLEMTFSEDIREGSGFITIKRVSDNSVIESIGSTSSNVKIVDNKVRVTLLNSLPENTTCFVQVSEGIFESIPGARFSGIIDNQTWRFSTGEARYPSITSLSPANNSDNVSPLTKNLEIAFSANIMKANSFRDGIRIYQLDNDQLVSFIPSYSNVITTVQNKAIIDLKDVVLNAETSYYVKISSRSFVYLPDAKGFPIIDDNETWQFSTGAFPEINTTSFVPENNSDNINLNINALEINFSEPVSKGTSGNIVLRNRNGDLTIKTIRVNSNSVLVNGSRVTIQLTNTLPYATLIYVTIDPGAFVGQADRSFAGITDKNAWSFSTISSSPLKMTGFTPFNGNENVPANLPNLEIRFSEVVQQNPESTGSLGIYRLSDNEEIALFTANSGAFAFGRSKVTINLQGLKLEPVTTYYIKINGDLFFNKLNKSFPAIEDNSTWRFTTSGTITGINDVEADPFQVFPNPSAKNLFIKVGHHPGKSINYTITDQVGKVVQENAFINNSQLYTIDLSNLPAAVYTLKLNAGSTQFVRRILKN